jgi:3,4-dihydroxy 2-butanone 4-phosphate synthase/GTP cyclohydrolase II
VCLALPEQDCVRLDLPPMHHTNSDGFGTAYRVTVDAAEGVGTGISARDRAYTARLLASATTRSDDLVRPGHLVPLAARAGGVLERAGHTEAAVDLTRLAGLPPAGVLCEIVSSREPTRMARRPELLDFAAEHGLVVVTIDDLAAYRRRTEPTVQRVVSSRLPTVAGASRAVGYRDLAGGEHVAFVVGDPAGEDVSVHVHVECLLGDVFGSLRCGCARRLDAAMRDIVAARRGVVVYLRTPGDIQPSLREQAACIGRLEAPCAPLDAPLALAILDDLGVRSVRHLHNPAPVRAALATSERIARAAGPSGEVA